MVCFRISSVEPQDLLEVVACKRICRRNQVAALFDGFFVFNSPIGCRRSRVRRWERRSAESSTADQASLVDSITQTWTELESFLAVHSPSVLATLNPPASSEQLRQFEEASRIALPAEVRRLYEVHNGQDIGKLRASSDLLFPPCLFLPLAAVETHLDDGNLREYAEPSMAEPDNPAKRQRKTKGTGRRLKPKPKALPSAFLSFLSSEVLGAEESSTGYLIGFFPSSNSSRSNQSPSSSSLSSSSSSVSAFPAIDLGCECQVMKCDFQSSLAPEKDKNFAVWFERMAAERRGQVLGESVLDLPPSTCLQGMSCIITGVFSMTPEQIAALVQKHGAVVQSAGTSTTTHIILGRSGVIGIYNVKTGKQTKKYKDAKAKSPGIQELDEATLFQTISDQRSCQIERPADQRRTP